MHKLKIIAVALGLVAFLAIYAVGLRDPVVDSRPSGAGATSEAATAPSVIPEPAEPATAPAIEKVVDQRQDDSKRPLVDENELRRSRTELSALIEEYNLYLHDRDKRAEIEARAAIVAERYKREVLATVKSRQ